MGNTENTETNENQTEETGAAGAETETEETQGEEGGKPDKSKAYEKVKQQRDEYKAKYEDIAKKVGELKASGEASDKEIAALQQEIATAKDEAEKAAKEAEFARVNTARLAKKGCVDIDVALGLLDENGDVDALKEAKPYLFASKKPSGLPPKGDTGKGDKIADLKKRFKIKE